ncbi:MAG: hypothetical protein [Caudoviricetes sp.]|nr:MAG: hypothetical protein [Caudoviricetes sp.]
MTTLTLREELTLVIRNGLDAIQENSMIVGKALCDVREDFENSALFLSWVQEEFQLGKAWTYKLMSIYSKFGACPVLSKVSNRVLATLTQYIDDKRVMDEAYALAEVGELTTNSLKVILNPIKVAGADKPEPVPAPQVEQEAKPPFDYGTVNIETTTTDASQSKLDGVLIHDSMRSVPTDREQALISQIEILNRTIDQLAEQLQVRTSERESKRASAPMLPQFKSKCLYARLGLSLEQSQTPSAVTKARRELVKLGYGDGHEAWSLIEEAVNGLLESSK